MSDRHDVFEAAAASLNEAYHAGQNLRRIDPEEKELNDETINEAKKAIAEAEIVYILGYGFDRKNSRRIGLFESLVRPESKKKSVLLTNFEDSTRVNMATSEIFYNHDDPIWSEPGARVVTGLTDTGDRVWMQKSVRNVYMAFELDFSNPEEKT
jgi:hypothetical protein